MKILLTVHDNSIAPRFDQTAEVIIAEHDGHGLTAEPRTIILPYKSAEALSELIVNEGVQCVVCGGIEDGCHNFSPGKKSRLSTASSAPTPKRCGDGLTANFDQERFSLQPETRSECGGRLAVAVNISQESLLKNQKDFLRPAHRSNA